MISWESILSVFDTKGTLLEWLQKLEKALNDGVLQSVTINNISEGVITFTFNFADGTSVTTPQVDIPQGAAGTIQVGTVTTGEAGTDVVIENTGTPQAAILNFTIPRGNTGAQGETGAAGPDIFNDFTSLKIDTTDATVTYIEGVAMITNARLIGYSSAGNEEIEIAVDIPIIAGDNVTIDASEDDKSIVISSTGGGGGGIEYAAELPTASETSPDFVQTPDGTLYRKKALESGSLLGTWVFNDTINLPQTALTEYSVSFNSNNVDYNSMHYNYGGPGVGELYYGSDTAYVIPPGISGYWENEAFKTIKITDISNLSDIPSFTSFITENATGGSTAVTYSYVALTDA